MLDVLVRLGCSGGAGLAHCLMEADVTVFKARIRTGKAKQVTDEFWVYDNRCELPNDIRCGQGPALMSGKTIFLLALHNAEAVCMSILLRLTLKITVETSSLCTSRTHAGLLSDIAFGP